MEDVSTRRPAVLLVGPTGSGKSPTGAALQRRTGWAHLDFGAELRAIISAADRHGLSEAEREYVRGLVEGSALFPGTASPLLRRIVEAFLARFAGAPGLVLNGVPRNIGQARTLAPVVAVGLIVRLECPPAVAATRVARRRAGEGADHTGRADDTPGHVRRKLELFSRETEPLLDHYRRQGVDLLSLPVAPETDGEALAAPVAARIASSWRSPPEPPRR